MSLRLTDFDTPVASEIVKLRGKMITIRALAASESARVRAAIPRPLPPMTAFYTKGSVAFALPEPTVDVSDHNFRRQHIEWAAQSNAAEVAVGIDWVCGNGKSAIDDPSLAATELRGHFTDVEIGGLVRTQDKLSSAAEEQALKNSSTPQTETCCGGTTGTACSLSDTASSGPSC